MNAPDRTTANRSIVSAVLPGAGAAVALVAMLIVAAIAGVAMVMM